MYTHHSEKALHRLYLLDYDYSPTPNDGVGEFCAFIFN